MTRRALHAIGWAAAACVLVLLVLTLATPMLSRRYVTHSIEQRISSTLGRAATVEDAHLALLPRPMVKIRKLVIAGEGEGQAPLAEIDSVRVKLALVPAILSGGRKLRAREVIVHRPRLAVSRAELSALKGRLPSSAQAVQEVSVVSLRVRDGTIQVAELLGTPITRFELDGREQGRGGPIRVLVRAAVLDKKPNANATIEVNRQLGLSGSFAVTGMKVVYLAPLLPGGLGDSIESGLASWNGTIRTEENGSYQLAGDAHFNEVRALGLGPMKGDSPFVASVVLGSNPVVTVEMKDFNLAAPSGQVRGSLRLQSSPPLATARATISRLDAGAILHHVEPPTEETAGGISEAVRKKLRKIGVDVDVSIGQLAFARATGTNVRFNGTMSDGKLVAKKLHGEVFGGTVDAAGSSFDLAARPPKLQVRLLARKIDGAEASEKLSGEEKVKGRFSAGAVVRAEGSSYAAIRQSMRGTGRFLAEDWSIKKGPLVSAIANLAASNKELTGDFTVENGEVSISRPIAFKVPLPQPPEPKGQARQKK